MVTGFGARDSNVSRLETFEILHTNKLYLTVGLIAMNHEMSTYLSEITMGTTHWPCSLFSYSLPIEHLQDHHQQGFNFDSLASS